MEQKEKKVSSASYLVNFYLTLENLNAYVAQYINLITFLNQKYKGLDVEQYSKALEQKDKEMLITVNESVRSFIIQSYIKFESLKGIFKDFKKSEKALNTSYETIDKQFYSDKTIYLQYCMELNKIFAESIIQEVLENQQDIYNDFMSKPAGDTDA